MISVICESFGCLPSAAQRELMDADGDLVFRILELRTYARAYHEIKTAEKPGDLDLSRPDLRRAWEIEAEIVKAEIRKAAEGGA